MARLLGESSGKLLLRERLAPPNTRTLLNAYPAVKSPSVEDWSEYAPGCYHLGL